MPNVGHLGCEAASPQRILPAGQVDSRRENPGLYQCSKGVSIILGQKEALVVGWLSHARKLPVKSLAPDRYYGFRLPLFSSLIIGGLNQRSGVRPRTDIAHSFGWLCQGNSS
jgi:hypothetical protein